MRPPPTDDRLPVVAIVGRQNVGKSSLLNAVARRRLSIVDATPGVTRDRVSAIVQAFGVPFELVDTAGMGMAREDRFYESVERQIQFALDRADVLVFVVDAIQGLTPLDREVAARLRKVDRPVLLVANKVDHDGIEAQLGVFGELGFGQPVAVSCAHRRALGDLLRALVATLPEREQPEFAPLKLAIVGKRNVGKSTLVNALAGEERVIVSEVPGTTRDAVDVHLERGERDFILIDTAGLRKRHRLEDAVELFSRARTRESVRRADVIVFMLDVTEKVTEVDKRIAGFIEEVKRPALIVLNKWDLVPAGYTPGQFTDYLAKTMPALSYAPLLILSAIRGERVSDILDVALQVHEQACTRIPTPEVNRVIEQAQRERSPGTRGIHEPKIYYATQTRTNPPSFTVFVNHPRNFTPDYVRFLERKIREYLPFAEVPIRLQLRPRAKKKA